MTKEKRERAKKMGDSRAKDPVVNDPMYAFAGPAGAMGRNNPMNAELNPNSPTPRGAFDPNGMSMPTDPTRTVNPSTGFSGQPQNVIPGTKNNSIPAALVKQPPADGADMLETERLANTWMQRVGEEQPVSPMGGYGALATSGSIPPTIPMNEMALALDGVSSVESAMRPQGKGTGRGARNGGSRPA